MLFGFRLPQAVAVKIISLTGMPSPATPRDEFIGPVEAAHNS